ncbi:hypothetical protein NDU88_002123 [Pleurodeles waltl]|uniref:HTH CENPB-type domain-containing protein n=1 Tax=Pleurodeles waltl TaxID=8319 RepID=A0AAV7U8D9_PLEWA|nr:hypothetical protein NDU88_002123 [Pleurodeles waltl]
MVGYENGRGAKRCLTIACLLGKCWVLDCGGCPGGGARGPPASERGPPKMAPLKRHAYEAQFKLQAISYAVVNGNRAAAKKFNINESMVRKWRKQQNELRQAKTTKQSSRGNKSRWPQLEDQLEQWIIEQITTGRSVSTVTIRLKATTIAQDMKIEHFQGGPSWCFRFMKRRHLSIRARTTVA